MLAWGPLWTLGRLPDQLGLSFLLREMGTRRAPAPQGRGEGSVGSPLIRG